MVATPKNNEVLEDFVCSQVYQPWTQTHSMDIAKELGISYSFVCKIIKTKNIKQFKRLRIQYMNDAIRQEK